MEFILEKEIALELDDFSLKASAEVLLKLKQLCLVYNLPAEEIVAEWVAFSCTKKKLEDPTLRLLNQMEKEVFLPRVLKKRKLTSKSVFLPACSSSSLDISELGYGPSNKKLDLNKSVPSSSKLPTPPSSSKSQTPTSSAKSRTPTSSAKSRTPPSSAKSRTPTSSAKSRTLPHVSPPSSYASRRGSGSVLFSFGATQGTEWCKGEEFSCDISAYDPAPFTPPSTAPYSWIDVLVALDRIIEREANLFAREYGIREWASLHLPSMECVAVVGRVVRDGEVVMLEGSLGVSGGRATPLDVAHLGSFSFFPGQIIAGISINTSTNKLIMETLLPGTFPACPLKPPDFPNCIDSLSVVIAAGPFATPDTLSYEPLWDLMKYVTHNKPNVVILVGPFVDARKNISEVGNLNECSKEIFKNIVNTIFKGLKLLSTKVVLVPSTKDVHHKQVYPTPPFEIDRSTQRLYLAPDPCLLNIEGVVFAITSQDILFHLAKEEIADPMQSDKLGRLCSYILMQKQFYPLYPSSEELNVDLLRCELHAQLPVMPHVLIVPSDLHYFIKDVHGCCCINPHRLAKFANGGSFARLKVCRVSKEKYTGSLIDSIHAQILKI